MRKFAAAVAVLFVALVVVVTGRTVRCVPYPAPDLIARLSAQ